MPFNAPKPWDPIGNALLVSLRRSLYASFRAALCKSLCDSLWFSIWAPLEVALRESLYDPLGRSLEESPDGSNRTGWDDALNPWATRDPWATVNSPLVDSLKALKDSFEETGHDE